MTAACLKIRAKQKRVIVKKLFLAQLFLSLSILTVTTVRPFTITIDPGHGGENEGARSINGLVIEKDANLDVGIYLAKILRSRGFTVNLTRTTDMSLSKDLLDDLQKRADKAKNSDLFVSIHFNETGSPIRTVNGQKFELYVPYGQKFPELSYKLAAHIHARLAHTIEPRWAGKLGNLNVVDGGIRQARFNVLERATCPAAVLVELAYLSDAIGEAKVARAVRAPKYAELLCDGIVDYAKSFEDKKGPKARSDNGSRAPKSVKEAGVKTKKSI